MLANSLELQTLNDLRDYVYRTICERNELEVDAYEMTERILVRGRVPCGIFFCVHGPRCVKFTAIWEVDRNSILFYGSAGERLDRLQLAPAPYLAESLN
jgi:hypothetical protein